MHVPYKGGGQAMADLIAGHVDLNMAAVSVAKPQVEGGKIKALAVTGDQRSPALPNVPTLKEAGVKTENVDLRFWFGLFGPKGMPEAVKAKIEKAVATVDGVRERARPARQARHHAGLCAGHRVAAEARERNHELDQVHRCPRHQAAMT